MSENQISDGNESASNSGMFPPPVPEKSSNYHVESKKPFNWELTAKIALLIALIGSFLPWARVWIVTVNGTDGDGIITAITSGIALILVFSGAKKLMSNQNSFGLLLSSTISAGITAAVYVYDLVNVASLSEEPSDEFIEISVQPQIGLIGGALGAVVGVVACLCLTRRARKVTKAS